MRILGSMRCRGERTQRIEIEYVSKVCHKINQKSNPNSKMRLKTSFYKP